MNDLPLSLYTGDAFASQRRLDPINLVFAGNLADLSTVKDILEQRLHLWTDKFVSDQYFSEPLPPVVSHRQDLNRTDALVSGFTGRMHTRTYQVFAEHPQIGRFVASPIHIDKWSWCGDVADSFDLARERAVAILRGLGYDAAYVDLVVNPEPVEQCDGRNTPWDGRTAVIAQAGFLGARGLVVVP